jgi:ribosome-associated translation inhibitor RaiA
MTEIRVESRNVTMTPRWKAEIEARVEALTQGHSDLLHARVTLTKNRHHKKLANVAEALVILTFPRRHTLTARKQDKTFEEAIRAAFAAAEIEVRKFRDRRNSHEVGITYADV